MSVPIITDFDLREYLGMRKGIYKEYFEMMKLLHLKNFQELKKYCNVNYTENIVTMSEQIVCLKLE